MNGTSSKQDRGPPPKNIAKLISDMAYRHDKWQIFNDFVEMAALSISNAVDPSQYDPREARYLEIVKRYERKELDQFPIMLASLTEELENEHSDVLGSVFHDLELHNKYSGQFFTPYSVSKMMASMVLGDKCDIESKIEGNGFVTAMEPACGSGAMVIALADCMKAVDVNYQKYLHVTAVDVDAKCVHMAYVQFSLLGIPACVVHGNSLSLEEHSHWYTPMHVMGGWHHRLRTHKPVPVSEAEPAAPSPPSSRPAQSLKLGQFSLF